MEPGTRVGPYEIADRLGEGGMGVVYAARDVRLGRTVALKFLPESMAANPENLARFEREARAASALTHPNICVLHDIGEYGDRPYLVMELLQGETLRERLDRGPLSESELLGLARDVASALQAAHDHGILHRDLKPANICLTSEGGAKILDFGVAKLTGSGPEDRTELTSAGTLLGTVKYMSPEQALGHEIDGRSDLFSLGAVLYEAASGRPPFDENSVGATLNAVINAPAPELRTVAGQVSEELVTIIERLLRKRPADRYATAAHLADALDRALAQVTGRPRRQRATGNTPVDDAGTPSVAVLPFANLSADPDNEYFSDGLAEELIIGLSRLPGLRVAARSSAFRFKNEPVGARTAGRELGVSSVLEGSVRRAGNRIRISVQLVDVDTGYQRWSERFDGTLDDIFAIQEETAEAIVQQLEVKLGPSGPQKVVRRHTDNRQAYELYLRGRFHWERRHKGSQRQAIDCFRRALVMDPDYALAHVGMAEAYWSLIVYAAAPLQETRDRARVAIDRALELAPDLAEAHAARGALEATNGSLASAARCLRTAAELDSSLWLTPSYGAMLAGMQLRTDDALRLSRRGIALEPESHYAWGLGGGAMLLGRDHESSVEMCSKALELEADSVVGLFVRGMSYSDNDQQELAITDLERCVDLGKRLPIFVGLLGMAHARAGNEMVAADLLAELEARRGTEFVARFALGFICVGLRDRETAHAHFLADLEAGAPRWLVCLAARPFPDLLEHVGLPVHERQTQASSQS